MQITAAEREFKRAQDAWDIHVIPERDFERARDDLETAKLNYAHAVETGGLEKDSLQLELRSQRAHARCAGAAGRRACTSVSTRSTLKSPVAGIVATLAQVERAQVAENAPLVTVVDLSALEIEFQVAESYANEIRPGMNAEVTLDGRKLIGTVAGISPDVRNSQVTGRVRFTEQPKGLRQNQRASVRIVLDERNDVLKVARSPFNDSDTRFVYVVRDDRGGAHAGGIRRRGHRRNRNPQRAQGRRRRRALRHARFQGRTQRPHRQLTTIFKEEGTCSR